LAGDYTADDRMLLDVVVSRVATSTTTRALALNEAVLEREGSGHTVRIDVAFDDQPFTPYEADALIMSTPTGSTAYAFSARGPIIEPSHRALLLTPVSPHMLFDRSLVLDTRTVVRLTVARHRHALLTVDGRILGPLTPGDSVECTASDAVARLVTARPGYFHAILKAKFGLRDR
jgi:NAD+ kinase